MRGERLQRTDEAAFWVGSSERRLLADSWFQL